MTCQNKKCKCAPELPKAELQADFSTVVSALSGLFRGVVDTTKVVYPSKDVAELAGMITDLVLENESMRALLGLQARGDVTLERRATDVTIQFGPGREYSLIIPVTGPIQKQELADSLRCVAQKLDPAQLNLPFSE